jgi:hypothetical protein
MNYKDAGVARTRWNQIRRKKIPSSATTTTKPKAGARKGAVKKGKKAASESDSDDEAQVKAEAEDNDEEAEAEEKTKPLPKKRGRPAKKPVAQPDSDHEAEANDNDANMEEANKDEEVEVEAEEDSKPAPKKRSRPAKATARKKTGGKVLASKTGRKVVSPAASDDEDGDPAPLTKKIKTESAGEEEAALGGADEEDGVKSEPEAEESEV